MASESCGYNSQLTRTTTNRESTKQNGGPFNWNAMAAQRQQFIPAAAYRASTGDQNSAPCGSGSIFTVPAPGLSVHSLSERTHAFPPAWIAARRNSSCIRPTVPVQRRHQNRAG